jgi:hypothetical protein
MTKRIRRVLAGLGIAAALTTGTTLTVTPQPSGDTTWGSDTTSDTTWSTQTTEDSDDDTGTGAVQGDTTWG